MQSKRVKILQFLCGIQSCPKHQDEYNDYKYKKLQPPLKTTLKKKGCAQMQGSVWVLFNDPLSDDEINELPLIAAILPNPDPTGAQGIAASYGVSKDILFEQLWEANGKKPIKVALLYLVRGYCFSKVFRNELISNTPAKAAISYCFPYLERDIDNLKPDKILMCGQEVINMFFQDNLELPTFRREYHHTITLKDKTYPVQGTFNPYLAYIAPVYLKSILDDCKKLFEKPKEAAPVSYKLIADLDEALDYIEFLEQFEDYIAIDTETQNLYRKSTNKLACIQFATNQHKGVVIPYQHWESPFSPDELNVLKKRFTKLFSNPIKSAGWVAHNAKFENMILEMHFGCMLDSAPIYDTQAMAFLLDETRSERKADIPKGGGIYTLKQLAWDLLNFTGYDKGILKIRGEGSLFDLPLKDLAEYGAIDAAITRRLHSKILELAKLEDYDEKLLKFTKLFYGPITKLIAHIERSGFKTNLKTLRQLSSKNGPFETRLQTLAEKLKATEAFHEANKLLLKNKAAGGTLSVLEETPWVLDINKPDHQALVFYKVLDLTPVSFSEKTGRPAIDDEFFTEYSSDPNKGVDGYLEVDLFYQYQETKKMRDTFINKIMERVDPETGDPDCRLDQRIRPDIHYSRLVTGRFAHVNPNLGQIPKSAEGLDPSVFDVRKAVKDLFTVDHGKALIQIDYKVNEVRWAAILAKDVELARIFNEAAERTLQACLSEDKEKIKEAEFFEDIHRNTASAAFGVPIEKVTKAQRTSSKCVDPYTLIQLNNKWTHIGDLSENRKIDSITSLTGLVTEDNRKVPLINFYSRGISDRITIIASKGVITCSKDHLLKLKNGKLIKAQDLKEGDILDYKKGLDTLTKDYLVQKFNPFFKRKNFNSKNTETKISIKIDEDVSYILGLYTGDGTVAGENGRQITISTGAHGKYLDWQKTVANSLRRVGFSPTIRRNKINSNNRWSGNVYIGGQIEANFFRAFNLIEPHFNKKISRVPISILNSKRSVQISYLAGLIDSDGSVDKRGRITLSTQHTSLLEGLAILLSNLNWNFNITKHWNIKYKKYYYLLEISKKSSTELRKYSRCKWKRKRLEKAEIERKVLLENKVKLILPNKGPLVDIEVDTKEHLYLGNTFIIHNCITFGILFQQSAKALSEAIGVSEEEAIEFQKKFFSKMTGVEKLILDLKTQAKTKGYVEAPHGRRRRFWAFKLPKSSPNKANQEARNLRQAVNSPIQGVASDSGMYGGAYSLLEYIRTNKKDWLIQNVVHDSCLLQVNANEVAEAIHLAKPIFVDKAMERMKEMGVEFNLPLGIDIELGVEWGSLEKWNGTKSQAIELQEKIINYWKSK